jgi:hypothetical protein
MFKELKGVRQILGEPRRRWFEADGLELIVWYGKGEQIIGFQLCYENGSKSKAITWEESSGFLFTGIDDGDIRYGKHKQSPVLVSDGNFQKDQIVTLFSGECPGLPDEIARLVKSKLEEYGPKLRC